MLGNSLTSDIQLQQYIDQLMIRYDYNRSGTLEAGELVNVFNDLFQMCGYPIRHNLFQVQQIMRSVDTNYDGKANKFELFNAFKRMIAQSCSLGMGANSYGDSWNPNFHGNQGFGRVW